eukprot:m.490485 g.490485  ORF g.490485 m.490485 type:complete len:251 (+) comp28147_c0_seq1:7-759(+)
MSFPVQILNMAAALSITRVVYTTVAEAARSPFVVVQRHQQAAHGFVQQPFAGIAGLSFVATAVHLYQSHGGGVFFRGLLPSVCSTLLTHAAIEGTYSAFHSIFPEALAEWMPAAMFVTLVVPMQVGVDRLRLNLAVGTNLPLRYWYNTLPTFVMGIVVYRGVQLLATPSMGSNFAVLAGGLLAYPLDTLRVVQLAKPELSVLDSTKQIYQEHGLIGYWNGLAMSLSMGLAVAAAQPMAAVALELIRSINA